MGAGGGFTTGVAVWCACWVRDEHEHCCVLLLSVAAVYH